MPPNEPPEISEQTQRPGLWKRFALWGERKITRLTDCGPEARRRNRTQRALCYVIRLSDAFGAHQCSLMACACAYIALLSVVPLLVLGIAAIGFLMRSPRHALNLVIGAVGGYAPNRAFLDSVQDILERIFADRHLIGLLGLAGLLFGAHQIFLAMQPAMNLVWVAPETRHWARQRLIAVVATLYTLLLLGVDLAASAFLVYLQNRPEYVFTSHATSFFLRLGVGLTPMVVITLLFVLLYQFLPARAVPWRSALVGAVVAALLWQITKIGFSYFLVHANSYSRLYGSLGSLVALVVWAYYSMAILLLGAEIAADHEAVRRGDKAVELRAESGADLAAASGVPVAVERAEKTEQAEAETASAASAESAGTAAETEKETRA